MSNRTVLQRIGNTPLIPLRGTATGARILLKLESENPTGSMKDRMALAMIEAAEEDGRLTPRRSGGGIYRRRHGVSLALVCAVKGYPLHIVSSDAFAHEKLDHMRILGATLQLVPQRRRAHDGEADPRHGRSSARHRSRRPAPSGPTS